MRTASTARLRTTGLEPSGKPFVALGLALALLGCRSEGRSNPQPNASASAALAAAAPFVRGETIVVEQTAAQFQETRVLEVKERRVRVDAAEGLEAVWVDSADVYRVSGTAPLISGSGSLAICKASAGNWVACKLERSDGSKLYATTAEGRSLTLSSADLIARPVTELNLKRHFERAASRSAFLRAAARAGVPVDRATGYQGRTPGCWRGATARGFRRGFANSTRSSRW